MTLRTWRTTAATVLALMAVTIGAGAALATIAPDGAVAGSISGAVDTHSKRQVAAATEGYLLDGYVGNIPDPRGGTMRFDATLAFPRGTVTGNGPQREGEADLRKPFVAITEERHAVNPASPGLPAYTHAVCTNLTNPASVGGFDPEADWTPNVYADITCDDGRGYDFYRVHWDFTLQGWYEQTPLVWLEPAVQLLVGHGTKYGQALPSPSHPYGDGFGTSNAHTEHHYDGGVDGLIWRETQRRPQTTVAFRVCGHRGEQVHCWQPEPLQGARGPHFVDWAHAAKLSTIKISAHRSEPDIW